MPELPDVEIFRRYLNSTALHKTIDNVEVEDAEVLESISADRLRGELCSRTPRETVRHGKYCLVKLDNGKWLTMHFGMTGFPRAYKDERSKPGHARILLHLGNGYTLAYDCQRKLGRVGLTEDDVAGFVREKKLGPDALKQSRQDFVQAVTSSKSMIKSALMRQENMAGLGNIYSDEILFQAGIHPRKRTAELSEKNVDELYEQTIEVLKTAIDKKADPNNFPEDFIIPHRHDDGRCPKCGGPIEKVKVSGRTGWYCPKCQRR